jgi:hypothetical protein
MARATKDRAELRWKDVHQVPQPRILLQVFNGELGPRLACRLPLHALLRGLVGPEMPTSKADAP